MKTKTKISHIASITESFIAANGYSGFRSHYKDVFQAERFDRIFIIKGGPGTGKSHTMRKIGENAIINGANCEYIYCSSDPHSLDAIILEKNGHRVAMLDGTAPHARDAEYPGSIDELVNLGSFWDDKQLRDQRNEIVLYGNKKRECYARAYRYLAIAGNADVLLSAELKPYILFDKMEKSIKREIRHLSPVEITSWDVRYLDACSMCGQFRLSPALDDTFIVSLEDVFGSARFYFQTFSAILKDRLKYAVCIYPSCFDETRIEGIFLPRNNILFLQNAANAEKTIHMRRFINLPQLAAKRSEIKRIHALRNSLQAQAAESLKEAGVFHFALESIYGKAMNYKDLNDYVEELTEQVLSYLQ